MLFKGWRYGIQPLDTSSDNKVVFSVDKGESWANLPMCLDKVYHSPTGFSWGYHGSGPAQLAFAILDKYFNGQETHFVESVYQKFKQEFVATWKGDSWELNSKDVEMWILSLPNE
jgi:hypothetical protein